MRLVCHHLVRWVVEGPDNAWTLRGTLGQLLSARLISTPRRLGFVTNANTCRLVRRVLEAEQEPLVAAGHQHDSVPETGQRSSPKPRDGVCMTQITVEQIV